MTGAQKPQTDASEMNRERSGRVNRVRFVTPPRLTANLQFVQCPGRRHSLTHTCEMCAQLPQVKHNLQLWVKYFVSELQVWRF